MERSKLPSGAGIIASSLHFTGIANTAAPGGIVQGGIKELNQEPKELGQDRKAVRQDRRAIRGEFKELGTDVKSDASKAEIIQDIEETKTDSRELRGDLRERRRIGASYVGSDTSSNRT